MANLVATVVFSSLSPDSQDVAWFYRSQANAVSVPPFEFVIAKLYPDVLLWAMVSPAA